MARLKEYAITGSSVQTLAESIERGVIDGSLPPGTKLPSIRTLAKSLEISPTSVSAAMAQLRRRGIVESRSRSGIAVSDRPPLGPARPAAPLPPGVRDLASGNPDPSLLPSRALYAPLIGDSHHLYGEPSVFDELAEIASTSLREAGVPAEGILAVSGTLDGLERALVANLSPGDKVAVEDPAWPAALDLLRSLGMPLLPMRIDDAGVTPAALQSALEAGARAVVLTPRSQNPTGAAFTASRCSDLQGILERYPDVLVCEDDHLGFVGHRELHSVAPARKRWVFIASVAKWLGPDLRVAVVTGDERTLSRLEGRQSVGPGWVSMVLQRIVAGLWGSPEIMASMDAVREVYAGRRVALVQALRNQGFEISATSGLDAWVPVADENLVFQSLLSNGYAVAPGRAFRFQAPSAIRVTFAALPEQEAATVAELIYDATRPRGATRAA